MASARFEAARVLFALTSASTAVRMAGQALVDLTVSHADNSAKLVLLDTLENLRRKHPRPLESLVSTTFCSALITLIFPPSDNDFPYLYQAVEVIRIVPVASDMEVRRKALQLAVSLTTERTASDFVDLLKRELRRVQRAQHHQADAVSASDAVLSALQSCLAAFPHTVPGVVTCVSTIWIILNNHHYNNDDYLFYAAGRVGII